MKLCTVSISKCQGENSEDKAPRAQSPEGGAQHPSLGCHHLTSRHCSKASGPGTGSGARAGTVQPTLPAPPPPQGRGQQGSSEEPALPQPLPNWGDRLRGSGPGQWVAPSSGSWQWWLGTVPGGNPRLAEGSGVSPGLAGCFRVSPGPWLVEVGLWGEPQAVRAYGMNPRLVAASKVSPRLAAASVASHRLVVGSRTSSGLAAGSRVSPRLAEGSRMSPRLTVGSWMSPRLAAGPKASPGLAEGRGSTPGFG